MRKLVTAVVVIAAIGIGAAPAFASYPSSITHSDPAGDVMIRHSNYAGNQDIDIRKAYYQLYGYKSDDPTLYTEFRLKAVRPGLKTHQLYLTEFRWSGALYRLYANDGGGASMYRLDESSGVWKVYTRCEVDAVLHPSSTSIGGNLVVRAEGCFADNAKVKILFSQTENYATSTMKNPTARDKVTINKWTQDH